MFYNFQGNTIYLKSFSGTHLIQGIDPRIQNPFVSQEEALVWLKEYLSNENRIIYDVSISYSVYENKLILTLITDVPLDIEDINLVIFNEHTQKYLTAVKSEGVFKAEIVLKPGSYYIDIEEFSFNDTSCYILCDEAKIKIEI